MCGIIGYIGKQKAVPIILDGLRRLEYRGYDSAGIALIHDGKTKIKRSVGKLRNLERVLPGEHLDGSIGLGHTRWATHGRPSEENAHPHKSGAITIVHNGIIENYLSLKKSLISEGHTFKSETDTEVLSHLIDKHRKREKSLEEAVMKALKEVKGSYALGIISEKDPGVIIGARNGCPLVLGLAQDGYFLASDVPAILNYTRQVIFLDDEELAIITPTQVRVTGLDGSPKKKEVTEIPWNPVMAEKGGYKHFMLKEIHEQPRSIMDTIRGRASIEDGAIHLEEIGLSSEDLKGVRRVYIIACGTSWHASLVGKFMMEELIRIPVEVDIASEFRYRNPIIEKNSLFVAVTQSGETADTLAALREAKSKGARTISICNVVGSTAARDADGILYTHAGPEIGVASTKAFTSQIAALFILIIYIGKAQGKIDKKSAIEMIRALTSTPKLIEGLLQKEKAISEIAKTYFKYDDFLYLGRGINYPLALEGALKLKELSYIHAEGYPAGEMKHGPIALIDEKMPVVVLIPENRVYDKVLSNLMEVKARGGKVIAIATEGDREIASRAEHAFYIPKVNYIIEPLLLSIPLQLLAYHIAVLRGSDVDQPRNLAKSVTVE